MTDNTLQKKLSETYQQVTTIPALVNSHVYTFDLTLDIDNEKLLGDIYKFRENNPKSMLDYNAKGTHVNAWHSDYMTHKQTDILNQLITIQNNKIQKVFSSSKIFVKTMWINIYTNGDNAKRHMHSENGWSTLYFPYVEKNPTPVIFDDNMFPKVKNFSITPKLGMFLLFPSTLFHHVPNITESKRISIAGNLNIVETKGVDLNESEMEYYNNV